MCISFSEKLKRVHWHTKQIVIPNTIWWWVNVSITLHIRKYMDKVVLQGIHDALRATYSRTKYQNYFLEVFGRCFMDRSKVDKGTCPPKLRMTVFTSSPIPSSFLTWNNIKSINTYLVYIPTVIPITSLKGKSFVYLLRGLVQSPHHQRNINCITECRHCSKVDIRYRK